MSGRCPLVASPLWFWYHLILRVKHEYIENVEYIPWSVNLSCLILVHMALSSLQNIQRILSARVKVTRKKMGLSQEALADAADIDRTYVSQLERALVNPSLAVLVRVANALDVSVCDLLE